METGYHQISALAAISFSMGFMSHGLSVSGRSLSR